MLLDELGVTSGGGGKFGEAGGPGGELVEALLPGQPVGAGAVEEDRPDDVAGPGGEGALVGGFVVEVHVEGRRDAGEEGLKCTEFGTDADGVGVHDGALGSPDLGEEALEVDVLGEPPEQGHREVGVEVDQAGEGEFAAPVDDRDLRSGPHVPPDPAAAPAALLHL